MRRFLGDRRVGRYVLTMAWANRATYWWVPLAAGIACSGCDASLPSGHAGTFAVQGTMTVNTCGPQAVVALSHLMFGAVLAYSRGRSTWSLPQTGVTVSGTWSDAPPEFRVSTSQYSTLRPGDRRYQLAACVIERFDVIDGTVSGLLPEANVTPLDSGVDVIPDGATLLPPDAGGATTFTATETIVYGAASGADCRDFIGAGQGQYLTLPCELVYAMDGVMITR